MSEQKKNPGRANRSGQRRGRRSPDAQPDEATRGTRPHVDKRPIYARLDGVTYAEARSFRRRLKRASAPNAVHAIAEDIELARLRVEERRACLPTITYPESLPVSARRDDIAEAIENNQVTVIAGETGSGKTTQIPKILLDLGRGVLGKIGHTQPRRLAARTVAERIADSTLR